MLLTCHTKGFLLLSTASRPWPHCGGLDGAFPVQSEMLSTASRPWPHCGTSSSYSRSARSGLSTASRPWPHCGMLPVSRFPGRGRDCFPRPQGRGPIAAQGPARPRAGRALSTASRPWPHCGTCSRKQHVLPSKLSTASRPWPHCGANVRATSRADNPPFHGLKAVAPLRLFASMKQSEGAGSFHGLKAVAPLRQPLAAGGVELPAVFPRPQGRGPIAASPTARTGAASPPFHGLKAVAPLRPLEKGAR